MKKLEILRSMRTLRFEIVERAPKKKLLDC